MLHEPCLELKDPRLLRSVLNEILNGFAIDDFDDAIGISEGEVQQLLAELNELPDDTGITLDRRRATAFRNALHKTLSELGIEEFHTRTGTDFEEGHDVLRRLNELDL